MSNSNSLPSSSSGLNCAYGGFVWCVCVCVFVFVCVVVCVVAGSFISDMSTNYKLQLHSQ